MSTIDLAGVTPTDPTATPKPTPPPAAPQPPAPAGGETAAPSEDGLGDGGKKALTAIRAERDEAKKKAAELTAQLEEIRAKEEGREAELKAEREAQRVKDEALAAADQRILKAEVRAAAAGKLADPQDALRFVDTSAFEVGKDGEVDAAAIAAAIDALVASKPYLAASDGARFQGGANGGASNGQLPSVNQQVAEAIKAGDTSLAIRLETQKLADQLGR